jgi:hypothetical protein
MGTAKANSGISGSSSTDTTPSAKRKGTTKGVRKPYVKRACINCKNAHAACEPQRPCSRCIQLNMADECVDAERKKPNRKPRSKQKAQQNGVVATGSDFTPPPPYPYMTMQPGVNMYGYPPFPNQYAFGGTFPTGFPMITNGVNANTQTPQTNNNTNGSPTSPTSAPTQPHVMVPYIPVFMPPNVNYWTTDGQQNAVMHPQMMNGYSNGYTSTPPRKKRKQADSDEEVDSDDEQNEEYDQDGDVNTISNNLQNEATNNDLLPTNYDVTTPSEDFLIDPMPTSPGGLTYESPVDDSLTTSTALALQQPPQQHPLHLHTQGLPRYSYQDSIFEEPFSPTSPMHHRLGANRQNEEKVEVIDLITENAATMLEDQAKTNNKSNNNNNNNNKTIAKRNVGNNPSNSNTSLVRVDEVPWTLLLSDIFKDDNGNTNIEWLNGDNSAVLETSESNFAIDNRGPRKAALNQDQLEQLLIRVWKKQNNQEKEIMELKQELRRVVNEMQSMKISEKKNSESMT